MISSSRSRKNSVYGGVSAGSPISVASRPATGSRSAGTEGSSTIRASNSGGSRAPVDVGSYHDGLATSATPAGGSQSAVGSSRESAATGALGGKLAAARPEQGVRRGRLRGRPAPHPRRDAGLRAAGRGRLDPVQLFPGLVVAAVDVQQVGEEPDGLVGPALTLHDVGQRLQGDHVFVVEVEHAREGGLGGDVVAQVEVAAAEDDAPRDVVGIQLEPESNDLQRARDLVTLAQRVGKRGGVPPRVFRELAFELVDLARVGHSPSWTRKLLRGLASE